ncbi:uncharacterized protein EMH_0017330 [Eimeria mitis]|uniref:Transmembrane protein n=1 Tax=Eimeria mitis TaxID=44415 RepID=U6KBZ4_9EIME|nr:uncharacterized protein EMH_0017330 [Eimeria mitis]CDJ33762.1 hypothetical protein, conserved [Eimeria mitis]
MRRVLLLFCLVVYFSSFVFITAQPGDLSTSPADTEADNVSSSSRVVGDAVVSASEAAAAEDAAAAAAAAEEASGSALGATAAAAAARRGAAAEGEEGKGRAVLPGVSVASRRMNLHKSPFAVGLLAASLGTAVFLSLWMKKEAEEQQKSFKQLQELQPDIERLSDLIGSERAMQLAAAYRDRVAAVDALRLLAASLGTAVFLSLWMKKEAEEQQKSFKQLQELLPDIERLSDLIGSERAMQLAAAYRDRVAAVDALLQQFAAARNPFYIRGVIRQLHAVVSSAEETAAELQQEAIRVSSSIEEVSLTDTDAWLALQPAFVSLGAPAYTLGHCLLSTRYLKADEEILQQQQQQQQQQDGDAAAAAAAEEEEEGKGMDASAAAAAAGAAARDDDAAGGAAAAALSPAAAAGIVGDAGSTLWQQQQLQQQQLFPQQQQQQQQHWQQQQQQQQEEDDDESEEEDELQYDEDDDELLQREEADEDE